MALPRAYDDGEGLSYILQAIIGLPAAAAASVREVDASRLLARNAGCRRAAAAPAAMQAFLRRRRAYSMFQGATGLFFSE